MRSPWHLAIALTAFFSGCTALTSELKDEGVIYHLPRSLLTVAVWEYHSTKTSRTWYSVGGITTDGKPTAKIDEETIADPDHRYAIQYNPSAFSDDRLCISRSTTGLLYDVQFASDDRVPEIAFNIARFVAGSVERKASYQQVADTNDTRIRGHTGKLDPFDPISVANFNDGMRRAFGAKLEIDFSRALGIVAPSRKALPKTCDHRGCTRKDLKEMCKPDHICYRTKLTLPIDLKLNNNSVDVNYADMINAYDIGAVSVTRAFLVHKISKFRFDKGALVAAIIRKPSEVEELSLMPIHIINAALVTPSGMWAAAFNSNNTDKSELVKSMIDISGKLSTVENQIRGLAQGTGPGFDSNNDVKYTLDCAAPTARSGNPVNVISGNF